MQTYKIVYADYMDIHMLPQLTSIRLIRALIPLLIRTGSNITSIGIEKLRTARHVLESWTLLN